MAGTKKSNVSAQPAGSPVEGEPAFLVIGKLRHAHGLRGEILMEIITDFPERIQPGVTVYIGQNNRPLRIRSRRSHGQGLLLAFDDFQTPEAVGELRNELVFVPTHDRPALAEGEYYYHQLLGLRVISDDGQDLGHLVEVMDTPANDIYVVRSDSGQERLLPAIQSVIQEIDLQKGEMHVHLLAGL
jgi:16S rRNA processing protein RimM